MTTTGSNSAVQRKMDASRKAASGAGRSAAGALRLALARAADDLFDLALSVIGVSHLRVERDNLGAHLSDDRLLMLLDGANGELGAVVVDRAVLTALIQQQTMGRLNANLADERPFTGTDAAMVAPLIDAALQRAVALVEKPQDIQCLRGFRFGVRAEDARAVTLAVEAERFRVFDLTVEFEGGSHQGGMCLILPEPDRPDDGDTGGSDRKQPNLGQAADMVRADLTAVICRMKLSLAEFTKMQPGDVLALSGEHLEQTDLVSIGGKKIAVGRLGQVGGLRALRLNETRPPVVDIAGNDGFAAETGVQPTALNDPGTIEGQLVQPDDAAKHQAQDTHPPDQGGVDDESDQAFERMTPEEAAVEISALAGLSLEDEGDEALPMVVD